MTMLESPPVTTATMALQGDVFVTNGGPMAIGSLTVEQATTALKWGAASAPALVKSHRPLMSDADFAIAERDPNAWWAATPLCAALTARLAPAKPVAAKPVAAKPVAAKPAPITPKPATVAPQRPSGPTAAETRLAGELASAKTELTNLKVEASSRSTEAARLRSDAEAARKRIVDLEALSLNQASSVDARVDAAQAELARVSGLVSAADKTIAELTGKLSAGKSDQRNQAEELANLTVERDAAIQAARQLESELEMLRQEVDAKADATIVSASSAEADVEYRKARAQEMIWRLVVAAGGWHITRGQIATALASSIEPDLAYTTPLIIDMSALWIMMRNAKSKLDKMMKVLTLGLSMAGMVMHAIGPMDAKNPGHRLHEAGMTWRVVIAVALPLLLGYLTMARMKNPPPKKRPKSKKGNKNVNP
jgi:predicted  nucleic acid-binding Zn-ribbon protein